MATEIPFESSDDEMKRLCFEGAWAWIILIIFFTCIVAFSLYLLRLLILGPYYSKKNRIDGKVVIITGCNTGIGKETALELAKRGARIYMACRDAARCEAARLEIMESTGNQQLFNRTLDLSSLSSVRQFAERFLAEEDRLDILINNAGVMGLPNKLTVDGFEQHFGVNHLGHFLLTNLLLERLKSSAPSRIIVLASLAYILGRIKKWDFNCEKKIATFSAYSQSKLANIMFTRKLSEILKDTKVTVNCCHPGIVRTQLDRNIKCPGWGILYFLGLYFAKTPKAGAQSSIRLALDPTLEKCSGGYYADTMRMPLLPWAKNKDVTEWLWKESENLVDLYSFNHIV